MQAPGRMELYYLNMLFILIWLILRTAQAGSVANNMLNQVSFAKYQATKAKLDLRDAGVYAKSSDTIFGDTSAT